MARTAGVEPRLELAVADDDTGDAQDIYWHPGETASSGYARRILEIVSDRPAHSLDRVTDYCLSVSMLIKSGYYGHELMVVDVRDAWRSTCLDLDDATAAELIAAAEKAADMAWGYPWSALRRAKALRLATDKLKRAAAGV